MLVIEDDPDISHLIVRTLSASRYDFLTTSSGLDGLRHAQYAAPDVITLDLALPDIGGIEVLARLERFDATRDIPVIVVSIHGDELPRIVGAFAVLPKPLDRAELRKAVAAAVASRQP